MVPQPGAPEMGPEACRKLCKKKVYLVTFPHPFKERSQDGVLLTAPETFTKKQMLENLLYAFKVPMFVDGASIQAQPSVPAVCQAQFKPCPAHDTVILGHQRA